MDRIETIAAWAGIIGLPVTVIGTVIGIMFVPQIFGGGPKLSVRFSMLDGPDDELRCIVENAPIKSRVLKWLKVPRAEPSISGTIKIQKHSDKKVVDSSIIVSDDGQQTLTPIVGFGAAFTVMYYCHEKHSIVIGSPETEEFEKERLLDGDYDLLLQIVHSRKSELFCRKISISDNSTIIKVFD